MLTISSTCLTFSFSYLTTLQSSLVMMTGKVMGHLYTGGLKSMAFVNKAICGTKESATNADELEEWTHTVLIPTLEGYSPGDIYNGDETVLFYKSLPHRTYCHVDGKPAGSTKRKDRITLLNHGWI